MQVISNKRAESWQYSPRDIHDALAVTVGVLREMETTAYSRAKDGETDMARIEVQLRSSRHMAEDAIRILEKNY